MEHIQRCALSFSGGKDSFLALDRAIRQGLSVDFLVTMYDASSQRVRFHGVPIALIHLADVRAWYEERTTDAGLIHCEPLWGDPPNKLVREFLARGYAAILTCIEEARANPTWLGAPLTEELIQAFEQSGIDPCGERGEYHTFVYAGPLFSFPLAFCLGERLSLPGFQLIDIQPQSDMH